MKKLVSIVVLGAAASIACTVQPQEEAASTADPIIGGSADTAHSSVGFINFEEVGSDGKSNTFMCTGSLVSSTVVLTAAHCVLPADSTAQNWRVYFGANPPQAAASDWVKVKEAHAHPSYDRKTIGDQNDVAVLVLETAQSLAPMRFATTPAIESLVGKPVQEVGYGVTIAAGTIKAGQGQRRNTINVSLNSVATNTFKTGRFGKTTCGGDSGGPAIMNIDGAETIVGVTSWGPSNCSGESTSARVDKVWSDFLSKYVSAPAAPPAATNPPPAASNPPPATNPPPSGGGSSNMQCCVNSQCYSCPDRASYDKCAGFDVSACYGACRDLACYQDCSAKAAAATHDPSGCTAK